MSEVRWIKIVTDVFDDEKIKLIEALPEGDTIIVIWFKVLCLAGRQNSGGLLMFTDKIAYTDEMLATVFRRPINTIRLALNTFEGFGMIERTDIGAISITNWAKHQSADRLEKIREDTRKRVSAYRERKALADKSVVTDCNVTCNEGVTQSNEQEEEEEKEIEVDKDSKKENTKKKEQGISSVTVMQFEKFWDIYSHVRNDTKKEALRCFRKRVEDEGYDPELIYECARNYVEHIRRDFVDDKYVMMPRTFLGPNLRFLEFKPKAETGKSVEDVFSGFKPKL